MVKWGISIGKAKVNNMARNEVKELIDGLLLGDGNLNVDKRNKNPNAIYQHAGKHREYILCVKSQLELLGFSFTGKNQDKIYTRYIERFNSEYYSICSKTHPILTEHRKRWYPQDKKIVPLNIELTPLTMLHWYIGDGTVHRGNEQIFGIDFATHGFSLEENTFLCNKMNDLGLKATIRIHKRAGNYLCILKKSCLDLLDYMGTCPVECYKYKWDRITSSLTRSQA